MNKLIAIIYIVAAAQSLFLSFMLLIKTENRIPNKILAVLSLFFSIDLFFTFLFFNGTVTNPNILVITSSTVVIYGLLLVPIAAAIPASPRILVTTRPPGTRESQLLAAS